MRKLTSHVTPVEPEQPPAESVRESVSEIFGEWWSTHIVDGVAHVRFFGEVGCTRPWKELFPQVAGAKDIKFHVDSIGGDSISGINLFHQMTGLVSETTITGRCFSAALTLALAGKKIRMERRARILCHAPHSWIYANAGQMALSSRHLAKTTAYLKKIIMERTELSETVVAGWLNGADVYFSAEQAKAYGLVDEIFDAPKLDFHGVPVATAEPENAAPQPTDDERFFYDILFALPRLKVRNRQDFLREVCASLFYTTDEISKL
jgi:ATP-dependent protease ClpP protease subunit